MSTKSHGAELIEIDKNFPFVPKEILKPMYLTPMIHGNICNILFPTPLPPDFYSLTYTCKSVKWSLREYLGGINALLSSAVLHMSTTGHCERWDLGRNKPWFGCFHDFMFL